MTAQEALRESERLLWQLVETLPAMIDCAAPDGEPIYRSQQLREFLGYDLEELDGTGKSRLAGTLDAGVHPDDLAGVKEKYAHSLSTGEPYARKHRLRRFDGEYRWVETRAAAMRNAEGAIVQWNVHLPGHRRRGSGAGRAASGARKTCAGEPGGEPCGAFGFDRARGEPAAGRHRRQLACLPALAFGRAAKHRARARSRWSASSGTPTRRRMSSAASAPCSGNPWRRGAARRSAASLPKRATSWPRRRRGVAFAWMSRSKATFRLSRSIASRFSRF